MRSGSAPVRSGNVIRDYAKQRATRRVAPEPSWPWVGALFTARAEASPEPWFEGAAPGTFSLELVHLDNPERGADIVLTFDWSSNENAFGVPGTDMTMGATTGPRSGNASGHGSMSPWTVRNTWFAWGADFKHGVVNRVPASNVDIAPTILALHGLEPSELDGRVRREALTDGPDHEKIPLETQSYTTAANDGAYRAAIQVTLVAHQRYIDKSRRLAARCRSTVAAVTANGRRQRAALRRTPTVRQPRRHSGRRCSDRRRCSREVRTTPRQLRRSAPRPGRN